MKPLRPRERAFAFFGGIALVAGSLLLMLASGDSHTPLPVQQALAPVVVVEQPPAAPVEYTANAVRLKVGRIHIDALVITLGVDAAGIMQSPDNPTDAAWYDFSPKPGNAGNVVMAAHVDFAGYGPAVF